MNIAIVDDNEYWLNRTTEFLKTHYTNEKVEVCRYSSGKQFVEENKEYDIVLMDIEMPEMNGFESIECYRHTYKDVVVIILTTHDELARKGFKYEAFRYIDKSNMEIELTEALDSAVRKLHYDKMIEVKVATVGMVSIKIKDIIYIETLRRDIVIHTKMDDLTCMNSMTEIEDKIKERKAEEGFYRTHRSFLVNLNCVTGFDSRNVRVSNGDEVILSGRKYTKFKRYLMEYRYHMANE